VDRYHFLQFGILDPKIQLLSSLTSGKGYYGSYHAYFIEKQFCGSVSLFAVWDSGSKNPIVIQLDQWNKIATLF
jgi:hypothetical protein